MEYVIGFNIGMLIVLLDGYATAELVQINDEGVSFSVIADIIEEGLRVNDGT